MTDELLKALQLIKEECCKYPQCSECPLENADCTCGVYANRPCDWKLKKKEVYF